MNLNWLKMQFTVAHLVALLPYVLGAILETYLHTHVLGNTSPAPVTGANVVSWCVLTTAYLTALLTRSPQDAWKLLTGTLLPAAVADVQSAPAVAERGYARIGVVIAAASLGVLSVLVAACLGKPAAAPVDGSDGGKIGVVGVGIDLVEIVACVYQKIDANEPPQQAADECGVTVDEVFKLITLADRRAAAKGLVKDAGAQ